MAQTTWHRNRWFKRYNLLKDIYEKYGTSDIKYAKKKKNYRMGIEPDLARPSQILANSPKLAKYYSIYLA